VVRLDDPEGDDHGDGSFVYPSLGFKDGDLDIKRFTVENKDDVAIFTVEFHGRINKPERGASDELGTDFTRIARHGFYQFNLDIYIDTNRLPGSGYTRLLPGRLAVARPDDAWDVAVVAAPRPTVTKNMLNEILREELKQRQLEKVAPEDRESSKEIKKLAASTIDRHVVFPNEFKVRRSSISFEVPHVILGGEARDTWAYTVLVTGADLESSLELMSSVGLDYSIRSNLGVVPVSPGEEWTNRFGGGQPGEPLQPPIVDMIVPPGTTQELLLADYSSRYDRQAVLPGTVPAGSNRDETIVGADVPHWALQDWQGKVCYEIFVRSFKDSDGDGIGDFNGLIEKLDYLNDGDPKTETDLGIEAIWLMPVFASPSYHGYDCIDYYRVNSEYGTEADFDRLLAECHRRGIEVVLDLMINHSSVQHPWFVESARDPEGDRRDWYVWRDDDPGWTQPWGGTYPVWHKRGEQYYYGIFWSGMPDFNFRNPAVMAEAKAIATFWLQRGVDGFRLDAARHLVAAGSGLQQNDTPETHAAWRDFSSFMRTSFPDRLMLGEIWSGPEDVAPYFGNADTVPGGDEFAMAFNFALSEGIINAVNLGDSGPLTSALARIQGIYPEGVLDGTFLANHDMTRLATQLGGNVAKQGLSAAMILTLPGTPWLYYGEEVGLKNGPAGGDEEKRTPMPWADDDMSFTDGVPWYHFARGREEANVATQADDPASLLSRYRRLIRVRQQSPALRGGTLQMVGLDGNPRSAVAYLRETAEQRVLIVHNMADSPVTLSWKLESPAADFEVLYGDRGVGEPSSASITMPARSTGVWEVQ